MEHIENSLRRRFRRLNCTSTAQNRLDNKAAWVSPCSTTIYISSYDKFVMYISYRASSEGYCCCPETNITTLPNCLLTSWLLTSCVSSTSPHIPVCQSTSKLAALAASSTVNFSWAVSSRKCASSALHSTTSLAAANNVFPANAALSKPASSKGGNPLTQPLITSFVICGCGVGMMVLASESGTISIPGHTLSVKYAIIGIAVRSWMLRKLSVRVLCVSYPGGSAAGSGAQHNRESVSRYRITVVTMLDRISPPPAASSSAMSRARETRDVRGIRSFFKACWEETRRSHSRATAVARCGLWCGTLRMAFEERRMGRLSR